MKIYILALVMLAGCSSESKEKPTIIEPLEPVRQVNLSFDDGVSLDSLHANRYLFKRYNASFTYYMSHYLSSNIDKSKALELQNEGYEIGHHGTWHQNAITYTAEHGINQYIELEIINSLSAMKADGLDVVSFAYPFGAHTEETDAALLEIFESVRYFESAEVEYTPSGGNKIAAFSIDAHRIDLNKIYDAMDNLKDGETLFLASHVVGEWENVWHITKSDLEAILSYGDSTNIKFCSVREC